MLGAALVSARPLQDWAFDAPVVQRQSHLQFTRIHSVDELNQALAQAKGKPVMLDLYADWCVACKEFEKYTFTSPEVQQALKDTVLLQVDVTKNSAQDAALLKHLRVLGLPRFCSSTNRARSSPRSVSPGLWMPRHSAPICAIDNRERHFRRENGGEDRAT